MSRLIINNHSDLPMQEVMQWVWSIVQQGRVSNEGKQYCYATRLPDGHVVYTSLLKNGDSFTILNPQDATDDTTEESNDAN